MSGDNDDHNPSFDGSKESGVTKRAKQDEINEKILKTGKRATRSRKRQSVYQTDDLIREKSPEFDPSVAVSQKSSTESISIEGKKAVRCNICKKCMTESKLANHIRHMHVKDKIEDKSIIVRPYKCDQCGKSYAIKYTWQQHVRTHTEGRPKCPECGLTFASAFGLFRHRVKNHDIEHNFKTFNCEHCEKGFFSISELTLHKQRHSSSKEFTCPKCQKAFSVKGNLRIHMRTHADEKLYKCDICEHSFSHPYSLMSHRRIHTNEFPYQCEICQKVYRSRHQLTSHKNVHNDNRPFKCDECSKTFRSRTAFKMHQDEHKGIKRFSCQFCDRKFQCHGNRLKHERRHIGDKKHKCHICDKGFIEKQELKNHMKVHEKRNQSNNHDDSKSISNIVSQ